MSIRRRLERLEAGREIRPAPARSGPTTLDMIRAIEADLIPHPLRHGHEDGF
ncbi:MAG: hypothetical protein M3R38_08100 [Actinomycetota bacterium]|nr:hypothetical protein [Actinomycetota bacterium]